MRNQKKLVLQQLDRKLAPFHSVVDVPLPDKGWINMIRTSLNMTLEQLGNKLGITKQGVKKLEENEVSQAISIKSLHDIARVMDMKFVYAFVPSSGSLEKLVEVRARQLAVKIIARTNQSMKLENQNIEDERINEAIDELTAEIKRDMRRAIWD
jgi:predicted DNA-binding mobile mystery protein A